MVRFYIMVRLQKSLLNIFFYFGVKPLFSYF